MEQVISFVYLLVFAVHSVTSTYHVNYTGDAAGRQLYDFTREHPEPLGLQTMSSGQPVEVRDTIAVNGDLLANKYHFDLVSHADGERIPERLIHARGTGAFGYFEVTHDVSRYTNADVFNGIGKKTPVAVRFSNVLQNLGGPEVGYDNRGFAIKFYTKEGNLDLLCLQIPVYWYRSPLDFANFVRSFKRNPRTNLFDFSMAWDFSTLRPTSLHAFLWILSDYGSPDGYRKMDAYPIQTFEISNKYGEKHYVRFNFRNEQGLSNLTAAENMAIGAEDPDYFTRDLYNAIDEENYPAWKLEMDIMTEEDVKKMYYNPFDVTVLWKKGTYHTVPIGRLIIDRKVENHFRDSEQAGYNPANLVPGIEGPVDFMFKSIRFAYNDALNYRLGRNYNKINVNTPRYAMTYNRDGHPPLRKNMEYAPNYYPNSFNGPIPYVDETKPESHLIVLESNAVDFKEPAYFYNHILDENARQRLANNVANTLLSTHPNVARRALKMMTLIDRDLGKRVIKALSQLKAISMAQTNEERYRRNAQCFERNMEEVLKRLH